MDVGMGNFEALDDDADPIDCHDGLEVPSDFFGRLPKVVVVVVGQVPNLVDLDFGHHQGVAVGDRIDGQKSDDPVVLIYFMAGDFAFDNAGEDRWLLHSSIVAAGGLRAAMAVYTNDGPKVVICLGGRGVVVNEVKTLLFGNSNHG